MRIAVVGTSNSMMRHGYTLPLRQSPRVKAFANHSLGVSVNLLSTLTTAGCDFSGFDVCLLDFNVNEEVYLRHGIPAETLQAALRDLVGRIWAAGCLPVLLLLPRRSVGLARSLTHAPTMALARELNLPVYDGFTLVERLAARPGLERKALFKDDGHLAFWVAIGLGHQLLAALLRLRRHLGERLAEPWQHVPHRLAPLAPVLPDRRVARQNSRFQGEFTLLRQGDAPLALTVPPGSQAVGLHSNLGQCAGILRLAGAGDSLLVDLRSDLQLTGHQPLMISVLGLQRPVAAGPEGRITLQLVPEAALTPEEKAGMMRLMPGQTPDLPDSGFAELGGLVLRLDATEERPDRPAASLGADLLTLGGSMALDMAIDLRATHEMTPLRSGGLDWGV